MRKIDQLREKSGQIRGALMLLPAVARDSIVLLQEVIDEQQATIDNLARLVNQLQDQIGERK